ncbi:glycosyltransferase [Nitrosomonas sp. Nm33]|uniref:glycosyltransferase n=1 Tax=Nitrosomonas sp. Nm33 TaxID=133724 RepID=UPI000B822F19|nr:glycosyltransferase [Nitrosomonas sp. Nm33]
MKALVITPFSPAEVNAGHRVRVEQVNRFLRSFCTEIDCAFLAFEGQHAWKIDSDEVRAVNAMFTRTFVLPAEKAGRPPEGSHGLHHLDEWFEPLFESFFHALARKTSYNIIVVHNVWLTKAFSYFPPTAVKWLEVHDVFHLRAAGFNRIGVRPDFFCSPKEEEMFGIQRSDLAVAIGQEEYEYLRRELPPSGNTRAALLPCDPVPDNQALVDSQRVDYLHPEKVTFGMLGSTHPFNVAGINALLNALQEEVGRTMAPVELLVAGNVSRVLKGRPSVNGLVRPLGFVENLDDFYAAIDYVVVPVFDGSGVNIKLTEAVRRGMPVLASSTVIRQAALRIGSGFADAHSMARELCRLALKRSSRLPMLLQVRRESLRFGEHRDECEQRLRSMIAVRRRTILIDTRCDDPKLEDLGILASVSLARGFQGVTEFVIRCSEDAEKRFHPARAYLPLFCTVANSDEAEESQHRHMIRLHPAVAPDFESQEWKRFWNGLAETPSGGRLQATLRRAYAGAVPAEWSLLSFFCRLFDQNLTWEPFIQAAVGGREAINGQYACFAGDQEFAQACETYARRALLLHDWKKLKFVQEGEAISTVIDLVLSAIGSPGRVQVLLFGNHPIEDCIASQPALHHFVPVRTIFGLRQFDRIVDDCRA